MIDLWRAACESPAICRQIGGFLCYPEQTVSQADRTSSKAAEHELAVRQLLELSSPLSVRISEIATGWLWPAARVAQRPLVGSVTRKTGDGCMAALEKLGRPVWVGSGHRTPTYRVAASAELWSIVTCALTDRFGAKGAI
jgi:hypothetical protein